MNNHTYTHRVGSILDKIGIDSQVEFSDPKISLITCTNRPEMISNILENLIVNYGKIKNLLDNRL